MATKRIDVLSDTHGRLSKEVLEALDGCDLIVHAGDITSEDDYITLQALAPLHLCLGNNDWPGQYGPEVTKVVRFEYEGLRFCVTHYHERLVGERFDVGVFGHTHVPERKTINSGALVMNPGSPTFPRSSAGPTMGRIYVEDGQVVSSEIVSLASGDADEAARSGRFLSGFFGF